MVNTRQILSGQLPTDLANEVSDAIHRALERGMDVDEAVCVVAAVAADYARSEYGDAFLPQLASIVTAQAGRRKPNDISR